MKRALVYDLVDPAIPEVISWIAEQEYNPYPNWVSLEQIETLKRELLGKTTQVRPRLFIQCVNDGLYRLAPLGYKSRITHVPMADKGNNTYYVGDPAHCVVDKLRALEAMDRDWVRKQTRALRSMQTDDVPDHLMKQIENRIRSLNVQLRLPKK